METKTYCNGYLKSGHYVPSIEICGDEMIPYVEAEWDYVSTEYIDAYDKEGNYLGVFDRTRKFSKIEKKSLKDYFHMKSFDVILVGFKFYKLYYPYGSWTQGEIQSLNSFLNSAKIGSFDIGWTKDEHKFNAPVCIGNSYTIINKNHANILRFDYNSFLENKKTFLLTCDDRSKIRVKFLFDETINEVARFYMTTPTMIKKKTFNKSDFMIKRLNSKITDTMNSPWRRSA